MGHNEHDCEIIMRFVNPTSGVGICIGLNKQPPEDAPEDIVKICMIKKEGEKTKIEADREITIEEAYWISKTLDYAPVYASIPASFNRCKQQ